VGLLGILGGMGPAATVDFYQKLIEETPARRDQDHIPVVIWADPRVPDRAAALLGSGPDPSPMLRRGLDALAGAGCDLVVVPCNTAHAFLGHLASAAGLRLLSLIDTTVEDLAAEGTQPVGLFATAGTLHARLYHEPFERHGIAVVTPSAEDQRRVASVIAAVKAGSNGAEDAAVLAEVAARLVSRGAERLVAACTEVVLAVGDKSLGAPLTDPARILARRVVRLVADAAIS